MNSRYFLAVLAATVLNLVLGFVIYGWALADFAKHHMGLDHETMNRVFITNNADVRMPWMILSSLAGGFLTATILLWTKVRTFTGGLRIGAIIGFLATAAMDF